MALGLVLLVLAYALGPISGAHINPGSEHGVLASGRISPLEAADYWVAEIVGGIVGAAVLTFLYVLIVLIVTRKAAWPQRGGVAIGLAWAPCT